MKKALYTVSQSAWVLFAVLAACTAMPEKQVVGPDWSAYQVTEEKVGCWDMQKRCLASVPFPVKPFLVASMACAEIGFDAQTCNIVYCSMTPGFAMEHEREHCRGKDHGGIIQAGWDGYIRSRGVVSR